MEIKPSGNITFLFTDIEGSTRLSQEFPEALKDALEIHNEILNSTIESRKGFVFDISGDAFCAAFQEAADAISVAVEIQKRLSNEQWKEAVIKIRIGIHSGFAEWNDHDYVGYITLARASRIMSAAYGGQIIISDSVYDKLKDIELSDITFQDLGERRLKDVKKPVHLYQVSAPGLEENFPPIKTPDARPNNLPVQLTSFVGREKEMNRIRELLKINSLVTLTGAGGAGKTRLALQIATGLIDHFESGVWFVELAAITDPELLPQALTGTFNIPENSNATFYESLSGYLKDKQILIILDNCEQIIDPCAELAEKLISNCKKLKIIATSREALKCKGEQIYIVPSLMLPDPNAEYSPELLMQFESVRLFLERAQAVNHSFSLNKENAAAIAGICARLDGIPLAIELAAARTNIMTAEKIYERLDDRFSLLTGGKRTALPRQQTLKALIEWSYGLLSDKEKILLSRLSVFTGGWTIEAAEEICEDKGIDANEILDLLSQLVEKSIVIYDEENERFRMLETIKQYAREKLKDPEKIFSKHLNYFLKLSPDKESEFTGINSKRWLDKINSEQSNFQSAIEWSIEAGEIEKGSKLVTAIYHFWEIRGHYFTGRRILNRILEKSFLLSDNSKAGILNSAGILAEAQGDFQEAVKLYSGSLALFKETGNKTGEANALSNLGNVALYQGDHAVSRKYYEESLALYRVLGNKQGIADCLLYMGILENNQGNYDEAKKFCEESWNYREKEDYSGIARTFFLQGDVNWKSGEYDLAKKHFNDSMEYQLKIGDKRGIASSYSRLGNVSFELGEYENAEKFSDESIRLHKEIGNKYGIVTALNTKGMLAMVQGEYKKADKIFKENLILRKETGDKYGIGNTLNNIGIISYYSGKYEIAKKFFDESLEIKKEIGDKEGIAIGIINLGRALYQLGKTDDGIKLLEESLKLRREMVEKRWVADTLNRLGCMLFYQGNHEKAKEYLDESLLLSRGTGVKIGIAETVINQGLVTEFYGDLKKAKQYYDEGLTLYRELRNKFGIAHTLVSTAGILGKNNYHETAIRILGTSESILENIGGMLETDQRNHKDEISKMLREKADEKEYIRLLEEGKKLSIDEAVGLALSDETVNKPGNPES